MIGNNSVTDLSIAGLLFRIHTPFPVSLGESFQPFLSRGGSADWEVVIREIPELPDLPAEQLYRNYLFSVRRAEQGFVRCFPNHSDGKEFYAVMQRGKDSAVVDIPFLKAESKSFETMEKCFSHVGFEELLMVKDRMILHASAVSTSFGGILFSGPSGIGKSTQAKLWVESEGCRMINGDRPILTRSGEGWLAYGSPYAGSSRCYVNESVPISAIVLLEQGESCQIRSVAAPEAFRRLYAQTVVNSWNPEYVASVCDMLTDLLDCVPVYCLRCTPDRKAVELLKSVLRKGEST